MTTQPAPAKDDLPEQMRVRRHRRERMLATGPHPYPVEVPRTRTLREIRDAHVGLPPDTVTGEQVAVTGRVIFCGTPASFASQRCTRATEQNCRPCSVWPVWALMGSLHGRLMSTSGITCP